MVNKKEYKGEFNVSEYLESQDLMFEGVDDSGRYKVSTMEGQEGTFDPIKHLKEEEGLDPSSINIYLSEQGSPIDDRGNFSENFNPVPTSPVGVWDRFRYDLVGNEHGFANYLKTKFDDAMVHPEKGLVVKNNGIWQQVDPDGKGQGDAWQIAGEIASDIGELGREAVELGAGIVGGAAGAVGGTALAPGAGTAAGAVAGRAGAAAAVSGGLNVLGRFLDMNEMDDDEIATNAGIDLALSLAGDAILPGGRLLVQGAKKATPALGKKAAGVASKRVIEAAKNTKGFSKAALKTFTSFFSGTPTPAANRLVDNFDDVAKVSDDIINGVKKQVGDSGNITPDMIDDYVLESQLDDLGKISEQYFPKLSAKFKKLEGELLKNPDAKNFSANISADIKDTLNALNEAGYIERVKGLSSTLTGGPGKIKLKNKEQLTKIITGIEGTGKLTAKAVDKMDELVNVLDKYKSVGEVTGRSGIQKTLEVRRALDNVYYSLEGSNSEGAKQLKQLFSPFFNKTRGNLVENFNKRPALLNSYKTMNEFFTNENNVRPMIEQMQNAKQFGAVDAEKGIATIYKKLNGNKTDAKIFLKRIEQAGSMVDDTNFTSKFLNREAAKYYSANVPNVKMLAGGPGIVLQGAVTGGLLYGAAETDSPMLDVLAGAAALTVLPRGAKTLNRTLLKGPGYISKKAGKNVVKAANLVKNVDANVRRSMLSSKSDLLNLMGNSLGQQEYEMFLQDLEDMESYNQ